MLEQSELSPNVIYFCCCCSWYIFRALVAASMELKHIMHAPNTSRKMAAFIIHCTRRDRVLNTDSALLGPYNLVGENRKAFLKEYN